MAYVEGETYIYTTHSAPTDITLSSSVVDQSSGPNAAVGTLTTVDANSASHIYTLAAGAGDTHNDSFAIATNVLNFSSSALTAGTYSVRIQTDDGIGGTFQKAFEITVVDDVAPVITSALTGTGIHGADFSYFITASGDDVTFGATQLPSGLGLTPGTGEISGTPDQAGDFSIQISATDSAGNVVTNSFDLAVAWEPALISLGSLTQDYDGHSRTITVSTIPAELTVSIAYDGSASAPTNADSYQVVASVNDDNYGGAITNTLVVTKAVLTLIASDTNRVYGQANPELSFGYAGFVNGEDSSVLAFQPTIDTTATAASPAGSYPIVITGGSDRNYTVSTTPGSLTVLAALTVSSNAGFYIPGLGSILVDTNSAVSDGGGVNFDGATLSFSIITNATTDDSLAIQSQGNSDGHIGVQEATVTYGGIAFGIYSGGDGTNALMFTFDTNATSVSVTALMRAVTFGTMDASQMTRVLTLVLAYDNITVSAQRLLKLNHSPTATDDAVTAAAGATIYIPFAQLLTNDSDADDDTLTVTITNSLSANGLLLTTNATGITYSATTNLFASDSFTYILDDGHGGQGQAGVTVTFLPMGRIGIVISDVNGAGATLTMAGAPCGSYQILASADLLTWTVINTVIASPTGIIEILDTEAKNNPTRFYRVVEEPMD